MDIAIIVNMATIVTAIGVWFAYFQSKTKQKQFHLQTLDRCIREFREYYTELKSNPSRDAIDSYVDLINEELFYFKYDYIPKVVDYDWIDGMIDFIPLTNEKEEILNPENCLHIIRDKRKELFMGFPRLRIAFALRGVYDISLAYNQEFETQEERAIQRKEIVRQIYRNVKSFDF